VNVNILISSSRNSSSIAERVVRSRMKEEKSNVYNIKHCIWCGKTGFKDSQEVIEHIKSTHTRAV
tara:strand:+ start:1238 stop:1432 length:195 start_codon:yes stop_codon:yes gene_type:complete